MLTFASSPISTGSWDHRPIVSSPLSSSPVRAQSPLSPTDSRNRSTQRQTQSSPIQPRSPRYASRRPIRQNPLMRKREDIHEARRRTFLHSVRQKTEDKAWQRRDIEGQFLKNSLLVDIRRLSHDAPALTETDLDDAMKFQEEEKRATDDDDVHGTITDDAELEAMVASYEPLQSHDAQRPTSPTLSDADYDDLFAELIAEEQTQSQSQSPTEHMDTS